MIRTQVYLNDQQAQAIALLAKRKKQKRAAIIRGLIQQGLQNMEKNQSGSNALLQLADLGKQLQLQGPKDISTNHDKYLYET